MKQLKLRTKFVLINIKISKKPNVKVSAKDKYLVLSTCREEDETIRANLYLRQIPDSEMSEFVKQHKDQLMYKPTR